MITPVMSKDFFIEMLGKMVEYEADGVKMQIGTDEIDVQFVDNNGTKIDDIAYFIDLDDED